MSVRGEVRYMPAETSVFRSRSSLTSLRSLGEEAARSRRRRSRRSRAGRRSARASARAREAVVADLAEVVGRAEPGGDHAARDERDSRCEQHETDEQEDDHGSTSDLDLDDLA